MSIPIRPFEKNNEDLYLGQLKALLNFLVAFLNQVKNLIKDGADGIRYLSAGDIYSRLLIHFSTLSFDDFKNFKLMLGTLFVLGQLFKRNVVKQQQIHDVLERADQRVTRVDKV